MNMTIYQAVAYVSNNGNAYAKAYARVAMMNWNSANVEKFEAQMLYIECNIAGMRGVNATEARRVIKAYNREPSVT